MRLKTAICLSLVLTIGFAGNIEEHDGLQACISDCGGLIKLYAKCEHQTDGDSAFKNCVCKDGNAESAFNSCAACAKKKGCTANEQNGKRIIVLIAVLDFLVTAGAQALLIASNRLGRAHARMRP